MSITRQDAIGRCQSLGKKFLIHFDKIYNNKNDINVHHWCSEMQNWYEDVISMKLKTNNKALSMTNLRDWFFTACAEPRDFFTSNDIDLEEEIYDNFYFELLRIKNVEQSLKNINLIMG